MKKNAGNLLLLLSVALVVAAVALDRAYLAGLEEKFMTLERQRIETSNKLATAKIVSENLNHVRDLVFKNMDFASQKDTIPHETRIFNFLTECINDLKLTLVAVRPLRPLTKDRITTYSYDIELEGDFFQIGEFCSKLENSRRIISLEEFDVQLVEKGEKKEGGPENKKVKVKMLINTYRVKKI
jgi:Tfp pilus assembly protein PilO